jgi:enoyl-CoA hydratase/carnithine racemase
VPGVELLTLAELLDDLAGPVLDGEGALRVPVRVVDLGGTPDPSLAAAVAAAARSADGVLVGLCADGRPDAALASVVESLDLTLVQSPDEAAPAPLVPVADPAEEAAALAMAVRSSPVAAGVLAGLLRWSGTIGVRQALDAESLAYSTLLGGPEFAGWLSSRGPRPLPPTADEPVLLDRRGHKLRVTLNRPERRNAYGRELRDALVAALSVAELDPTVTRVLLDGAGPAFCSGGDLDEFGTTPDLATAHLIRTRAGAALPLVRMADRVEARLHGACVGAGIELPAFAGRVVAAPGTRIRLPELGMGLIPGAGGTVSIPRRIGRWRTLWLALSGTALDERTALTWGLVDAVADAAS